MDRSGCLSKRMHNFAALKAESGTFLNFPQAVIKIRIGNTVCGIIQHLHDKDRVNLSVVLLITVLIPVIPLSLPVVCGGL
ncbi:hypothetical protein SDC9_154876 [bioreactor metagenome]|uniref:Uncharacterized protein n=1 Tax=bioreactor metagenome TaxID=1076179 RepID=A0A645EZX4_9ZZZZ